MVRISFLRLALMATFLIVASDAHTQTKTAQPTGEPKVQTQPGTEIKLFVHDNAARVRAKSRPGRFRVPMDRSRRGI